MRRAVSPAQVDSRALGNVPVCTVFMHAPRRTMTLVEDAKRFVERMTGFGRPKPKQLADLVRPVTPQRYRFKDDGATPNNPSLPLLLYRRVIMLPKEFDPAAVIELLFARNGWKDSWRDGIYDFLH